MLAIFNMVFWVVGFAFTFPVLWEFFSLLFAFHSFLLGEL